MDLPFRSFQPDFSQFQKILRREGAERPVLFEFINPSKTAIICGCMLQTTKNSLFLHRDQERIMRVPTLLWLAPALVVLLSCQNSDDRVLKRLDRLRSEETDRHNIVYAYAAYLSTTRTITPEKAIPLINEMISFGYPTEARYSIDNLERNGIHSCDLLALHGLCYQHELQPGLALADFEKALAGDPGNGKIRLLLDNAKGAESPGSQAEKMLEVAGVMMAQKQYDASDSVLNAILALESASHRAAYLKGLIRLQKEQYDSALYFMKLANSIEDREEYRHHMAMVSRVLEGEKLISGDPLSFSGYLQKSQGLASMGMFIRAQGTLDRGLEKNPDQQSLILAKALVWVQAGQQETARQYLWEQEQRGIVIDPALKQKILANRQLNRE
jgi:hypothetical protein